jgi:competence protein ComEA
MPTPSERRALVLVTVVAVLGVAARLSGATGRTAVATPEQLKALDAQIARVESARAARRGQGARPRASTGPSSAGSAARVTTPRASPSPASGEVPRAPVDLDAASRVEIEALPWIGPALAERIVRDRERCGPFGSLDALQRVAGIGAGLAKRLEAHVTFSTSSRPRGAASAPGCARADKRAAPRARGRFS